MKYLIILFLLLAGFEAITPLQFIFLLPATIIIIDVIGKIWKDINNTELDDEEPFKSKNK